MLYLYHTLLVIHIAGGTVSLIAGTIATAVIKGKKAHTINGKIFFYGMLATSVSALVISNLPGHNNVFLFTVGGFTLYMVASGYRIIWLKRNKLKSEKPFSSIDFGITAFAIGFGTYLLYQAVRDFINSNAFGIVPFIFGVICFIYVWLDYRLYSGKKPLQQSWISNHLTRMLGALIAAYTAFLVVNVQIQMQWILWVLPSAIGTILISRFLTKYSIQNSKIKVTETPLSNLTSASASASTSTSTST